MMYFQLGLQNRSWRIRHLRPRTRTTAGVRANGDNQ